MYRTFWKLYAKEYGSLGTLVLICGLTVALVLLEVLNISLLVPLLETLGSPDGAGNHWVSRTLAGLFEQAGLPFNLETILITLGVFIAVLGMLKYTRMLLVARARAGFLTWLRSKTMWNLLHADVAYYHHERLGTSTDTLITQANFAAQTVFVITEIIAIIGVVGVYIVAAFLISPALTAVAFAMMLLVTLGVQRLVSKAGVIGKFMVDQNNELQVTTLETMTGIRVIKSNLLETLRWEDFQNRASLVSEALYRVERNRSQLVVIQETVLFSVVALMVFLGVGVMGYDFAVTATLLFILYRLAPRITNLNTLRATLAITMSALQRVTKTIDETSTTKIISGTKPFTELHHEISFRQVDFSYDDGTQVLRNSVFTIESRKMTAVVGASGEGKSTIIDLILRYYDPNKGSILVDGIDLRELDLEAWRGSIGLVSQDVFLFNDTISNNIRLGQLGAETADLIDAAKQAYAHDFIQGLAMGYDTVVGDRGWNLSGGERQRIALARAILRKPKILILDEATSSLDSESEQLIQKYISDVRGTCTIVVVAHRLSTIQSADKIIVLQDGKIVEEGDWGSLLATNGVFARYHRLQVGGRADGDETSVSAPDEVGGEMVQRGR